MILRPMIAGWHTTRLPARPTLHAKSCIRTRPTLSVARLISSYVRDAERLHSDISTSCANSAISEKMQRFSSLPVIERFSPAWHNRSLTYGLRSQEMPIFVLQFVTVFLGLKPERFSLGAICKTYTLHKVLNWWASNGWIGDLPYKVRFPVHIPFLSIRLEILTLSCCIMRILRRCRLWREIIFNSNSACLVGNRTVLYIHSYLTVCIFPCVRF